MKRVSQVELKRLKKKGKVRKKMGAQPAKERPVPVATSGEGMSGSAPTEQPAPVLPPAPAPEPMASMAAPMAVRDALLEDLIANNTRAISEFGARLEAMKPAELSAWQKAAFIRHKVVRDNKSSLIDYVDSVPMEA